VKAIELVRRLNDLQKYPPHDEMAAKVAFLMNLVGLLKVELPDGEGIGRVRGATRSMLAEVNVGEKLSFLAGVLVGRGGEIDPRDIQQAHELMSFPFTRAIISTALGHSEVTGLGVPAEYSRRT